MASRPAAPALSFARSAHAFGALSADAVAPPLAVQFGPLALSVTVQSSFEAVKDQWRALERTLELSPFQSFDWCREFWLSGCAGAGAKLDIITGVTEAGDTVILIPLVTTQRFGVRVTRMLNDENAAHRAPILAPAVLDALAAPEAREQLFALIRTLTGADVALLEQQPASLFQRANPLLGASACNHHDEIAEAHFTASSWQEFDKAHRSSKSRGRDKKRLEGLASFGPVSVYKPQTLFERQAFLDEILARKSEALKRRGVYVFEDPKTRDFLMRLAALDAKTSTTVPEFHGLRVGDTWAAAQFGVVHGTTAAGLIIAMGLPEAQASSPGHLLMVHVLKDYFESGVVRFSFGLGESDLKTRWTDDRMAVLSDAVALSPLGLPYAAAKRAFWWTKREIKRRPALFTAASRARVFVHDVRTFLAP